MIGYSSNLNTSYNAFQAQLSKRFSHGLQFHGHYTWSKAIDQCSTEVIGSCVQQNPYSPAADRGLGDYDRTHVAVITYIYEIPKISAVPRFLRPAVGHVREESLLSARRAFPSRASRRHQQLIEPHGLRCSRK